MKLKQFFATTIFVISSLSISAQYDINNSITLQIGASAAHKYMADDLGWLSSTDFGYGTYDGVNIPGIFARWEHGRVVSVSVDLGYNRSKATYTPGDKPGSLGYREYTGQAFTFGTRGVWHILENGLGRKLVNGEGDPKIDVYTAVGFYVGFWSYSPEKEELLNSDLGIQLSVPLILGGRYYFSEKMGICAEITTYKNNVFNVGLSYRFETL